MSHHSKNYNFKTRVIHQGRNPKAQSGFVNPAVTHGSTVVFDTVEAFEQAQNKKHDKGNILCHRLGNPTAFALEDALANLENGYAGLTVSSGLAAITTSLMAFLKQGDHALIADTVYEPTRYFCDTVLKKMGIAISYYDPMIGADIDTLIEANTQVIYLESPGSMTFEVSDVPAVTKIAKQRGIVTIMDNTWATPYFFRPLDHGVNLSISAGTKYLVGHSDAMLGTIVCDQTHYQTIRVYKDSIGQCVGPDDLFLSLRGLRTLPLRMHQHQAQGLALANWLQQQPDVIRVLHPAFPDCPGHSFWQRDFTGASGLFAFEMTMKSKQAISHFLDNLSLFSMGASWGAFESLILPTDPSSTRTATPWQGTGQLFRVHAGLEYIDDLLQDLSDGLARYRSID